MATAPAPVTTPGPAGAPARWGAQVSFWQRHQPAFWVFVLVLGITGLDFLAQQAQMISAAPVAWFVTVLLLLPYAIPVIALIYYLDLYEREPVSILVACLLWGGIAATTLSMYTNTPLMEVVFKLTGDADFTNEWSAALTAPFVEELFKGLAIVLLVAIARDELDDILDGFVWGAMVGVGFLLVEDVLYFVRAFAETGSMASVFQMFLIRIIGAGPYSHFLYTGLVGMGVAYYVVRTDRTLGRRLLAGAGLVAAGVAAHFFWNSPLLGELLGEDPGLFGWLAYVTAKGLPMLIGLAIVVRLARQRERRWFADLAAGFGDDGCITPEEVVELSGLRSRRRARNAAGRERGPAGKRLKGRIQKQQLGLAMLYSRFGSEEHPDVAAKMGEILALKAEYGALHPVRAGVDAWGGGAVPGSAVTGAVPGSQPAAAAMPAAAWAPTHVAPSGGLPAWAAPDPARPPVVTVAGGLDLVVAERAGAWARVVAVNGWTGWVDGRRLVSRA